MAAPVTAGDLRDRVAWYAPVRTKNAAGQLSVTHPTASSTTAAKVEAVAGTEGDKHAQQTPLVAYEITIRSRTVPDLKADWLAVWVNRGRTLNVTAVLPHPNGGEWVLVRATERPPSTPA